MRHEVESNSCAVSGSGDLLHLTTESRKLKIYTHKVPLWTLETNEICFYQNLSGLRRRGIARSRIKTLYGQSSKVHQQEDFAKEA